MIDRQMIIKILKMRQNEIKHFAKKVLKANGYTPLLSDGFLYAKGDLPILMVAHMDTVYNPPKFIRDINGILSGKKGLGADDRAGVYGILHLIKDGYRPSVLLLEDEEIGCIGARKFVDYNLDIGDIRYIIELDRQGKDDCVFYDCYNEDFIDYVEDFGFKMDFGSYSDIVEIAPEYDIAAVNLSVGYYNQHTHKEFLVLDQLDATLKKVALMLESVPSSSFRFHVANSKYNSWSKYEYRYGFGSYSKAYGYDEWWGKYTKDDIIEETKNGIDLDDDEVPFEYDDDEYDDGKWYNHCDARILLPLHDCLVNLATQELIDTNYDTDYMIGDDNKIYHTVHGIQRGAIVFAYDFKELCFDDFNGRKSWDEYMSDVERFRDKYDDEDDDDSEEYYYCGGWSTVEK